MKPQRPKRHTIRGGLRLRELAYGALDSNIPRRFPFSLLCLVFLTLALTSCSGPTRPLFSPPEVQVIDMLPVWSPSGDSIVYNRVVASRDGPPGLYITHRLGGRARLIAPVLLWNPRFSPDGHRLVGGVSQLATVNVDTGELRQLTFTHNHASGPDWSPDGLTIAYFRVFGDPGESLDSTGLYLYHTATDTHAPLKHDGVATQGGDPRWSPDGTRIVFMYGNGIYIIAPDGTGLQLLIHAPYGQEYGYPRWLCDNHQVLFYRLSGELQLLLLNTLTGTQSIWPAYYPYESAISPDCNEIVVQGVDASDPNHLRRILVVRALATGRYIRQLTSYVSPTGLSSHRAIDRQSVSVAFPGLWPDE